MLSIFAQETTALESQVSALQSQLAAAQQRIALLAETELLAGGSLEALKTAIQRTTALAPDAIAAFRSAVFGLFNDRNDDDNGNEPLSPAPQPNDPQPELVKENIDATSTEVEPELIKEEIVEQADNTPVFDLVPVSDAVAYFKNTQTGEIACTYLGGNNKEKLQNWASWLCTQHSVASGFELRKATRLTNFKHELKLWGLSIKQITRLSEADTTKTPPSRYHVASFPVAANLLQEDEAAPQEEVKQVEVSIDINDVPAGVKLEHLNNAFKTEYRVWVWYVGRNLGIIQPHQKTVGTIMGSATGITAYRINGLNNSNQVFTRTLDAVKYLIAHSGYKLDAIHDAYFRHNEEVAAASVQPPLPQASATAEKEPEINAGDWVELLVNGDRFQVDSVTSEGVNLTTDDGCMCVQADEVKLLFRAPADWNPF